jgi:hypothetical protein
MTTMMAAVTASSPPVTHAVAGGREPRSRGSRRPPTGHGSPQASAPAGDAADGPASAQAPAAVDDAADDPPAADVRAPADAPASAGVLRSASAAATIGTASPSACDRRAPKSASSRSAAGRLPGSLARQLPTSDRSSHGMSPSSAGLLTSRYISAALDPEPNGPCPVHAKVSTAPKLKMSLGGSALSPRACSGDKNPGEP